MAGYYPPWGFYYRVEFGISKNKNDTGFQSVSGLSVEYEMEEFREGGENRFTHKLPVRTKYAELVLKRGMLTDSDVIKWCLAAFRDRDFRPTDLSIILLNEQSEPLRTWNVTQAIPKKWLVSDLNSNDNAVVVETLELMYRYFSVQ
ncbi:MULTISPECIES: phage tail protein [Hymenobacter]|uniref:Phage tail protein n=1 Tax=Hymenobacter jejuensis TaxID=2502781 RepID=A0A5B8A3A0_9BACT|nr:MULTISPECIES: phage tail protein [Hymenobacter]MBC6989583.1 phage tail protein [Hymenobacter sp. BT491]QDA61599.1 phage tail protein [Hymenobacter jejuensis]